MMDKTMITNNTNNNNNHRPRQVSLGERLLHLYTKTSPSGPKKPPNDANKSADASSPSDGLTPPIRDSIGNNNRNNNSLVCFFPRRHRRLFKQSIASTRSWGFLRESSTVD